MDTVFRKRFAAILALALLFVFSSSPLNAVENEILKKIALEPKNFATIGEAFEGEELRYDIGFWFFDRIAVGKISLKKESNGEYVATLTAYTTGTVDRVFRRKDVYTSRMRMADNGRRFVTLSFDRDVDNNGKVRKGRTVYDYQKRIISWKAWNGTEKHGQMEMPKDIYCDDPIAAFYNFRYGSYGSVSEGARFKIYSMPRKEDVVPHIDMRIAKKREFEKKRKEARAPVDYLAFVNLDREMFGSKSGDIEILFSGDMLPRFVVARDIMVFGDVKGRLMETNVVNIEK